MKKKQIKKYWLNTRIKIKWLRDKSRLPLDNELKELYFNIHKTCWKHLNRFPNLANCQDYNDKIQWLKLFDQSELIIQCSDKISVRDFVESRLDKDHLPKLYQTGNSFEDINLETLPDAFVIKTNHDSGTVILVSSKSHADLIHIKNKIAKSLNRNYGWEKGEWAYSYIKPKVFVEEHITPKENTPPPDFKFHCVNGKVKWLQYIFDRGLHTKEVIVDPTGKALPIHFDHNMIHCTEFSPPNEWEKLVTAAEILSSSFKYVRVDMYLHNNKIFIGELTFYPLKGCYKGNGQVELGKLLDFDTTSFKHPILKTQNRNQI